MRIENKHTVAEKSQKKEKEFLYYTLDAVSFFGSSTRTHKRQKSEWQTGARFKLIYMAISPWL